MPPETEPFSDVEFKTEYPRHSVSEHEMLMAFRNDDDAADFRAWWSEEGALLFAKWIERD